MSREGPAPRYERPIERPVGCLPGREPIPPARQEAVIAASGLPHGSKGFLRRLMRLGQTAIFGGGGVGLDYAGLLKSAVRLDIVGGHVAEVAAALRQRDIDLLLVPGMSGFPIGTMYALAAGIPGLLLRKEPLRDAHPECAVPPGRLSCRPAPAAARR